MRITAILRSGHGHAAPKYIRHSGPPTPQVSGFYKHTATILGATMWCWMFYRAKHDWKAWCGLEHPWDHSEH